MHCKKMVGGVEEDEGRDGAGRGELGEGLDAEGFAFDPPGVAVPLGLDAEAFEGLFQNPGFAGGALEEDGPVGDAAG